MTAQSCASRASVDANFSGAELDVCHCTTVKLLAAAQMIDFDPFLSELRHGSVVHERTGLCGGCPYQRRADWGITAGRETARMACHRAPRT